MIDGGFDVDECAAVVAAFTAEATVDYFSLDVGNSWGDPSYIPIDLVRRPPMGAPCGQVKEATHLPIVYAGRVLDVSQAEAVLAAGQADIVAMARATMADPEIVAKTRAGAEDRVRPCIALNECIHRKLVEGLTYACAVNLRFGREAEPGPPPAAASRSVLVVGGGPAGTELAALCAERGHRVELRERNPHLGGALAVAALARANRRYQDWIDYQARRLEAAGVRVVRRPGSHRQRRAGRSGRRRWRGHRCRAPPARRAWHRPAARRDHPRSARRHRCARPERDRRGRGRHGAAPRRSPITSPGWATKSRSSIRPQGSPRWSASTHRERCSPASSTAA